VDKSLLLPVVMGPAARYERIPVEEYYPGAPYFVVWLIPVALLLVASVLAFLASKTG
jgi:hypothetical protein